MNQAAVTPRWTPLRHHAEQQRLWDSPARFKIVSAGRRSGKTELAKRNVARRAPADPVEGARYFLAAPTVAQAKEIFWRDLQALIPPALTRKTNHTELSIELVTGARVMIAGLDKPQRIEGGSTLRGIVVDEIANCPPSAWHEHVRPCLSDAGAEGWAWLIGVPEGRNFFYDLHLDGLARKHGEWDSFTWHSADILAREEIERVRGEMDERTFRQEYEGGFESFEGRAYYAFEPENVRACEHDPRLDLVFALDFNVSPGTAVVLQEQVVDGAAATCVIGEVWINDHSNTPLVCEHLRRAWAGRHDGTVVCRGDETGGRRGTAKVQGSDWDLVREHLRRGFAGRVRVDLPDRNPPERDRVNAVNARLRAADGTRRLFVDGQKAKHLVKDLGSVEADNAGCLVKPTGGPGRFLTHPSDALGYHVHRKHPVRSGGKVWVEQL